MWVDTLRWLAWPHGPRKGLSCAGGWRSAFTLSNNWLYPALRRFTEAGVVTRDSEAQDGGRHRHF